MTSLEKITSELQELGYSPFCINTSQGEGVAISYEISSGKHQGQKVLLGFSFLHYPAHPPHWIFICPSIYSDGRENQMVLPCKDDTGAEKEWRAFSRPFDAWDRSNKDIKAYLDVHIVRFCYNLQ